MMLFQETTPVTLGQSLISKVIYYLNYPFINQTQFKVSMLSLLMLGLIMLMAWGFSRYLRRFLERRVLATHLDVSLRFTLLRLLHYIIIVAGFLYGLKLGFNIDLTSVAVLLGFLSVGIGFGLQYIASDLVSGLILLFERPVRVGDRLKIGDIEGRVENISLRTTLIITNDRIAVIVPNSDLVRNKFINWSYGSQDVRIRVPIGVTHDSDLEKVREALIAAGRAVKEVLEDPTPQVHLVSFGDSSINFELLVWIDQPHKHPKIRSDINFHIATVFREKGIEIPSIQRESIYVRMGSNYSQTDLRNT